MRLAPFVLALLLAACSDGSKDVAKISAEELWQKFFENGASARERRLGSTEAFRGTASFAIGLRIKKAHAPAPSSGLSPANALVLEKTSSVRSKWAGRRRRAADRFAARTASEAVSLKPINGNRGASSSR